MTLLTDQEVAVTLDGQIASPLKEHDRMEIAQASARTRLVRFPRKDFFSVLEWGERWEAVDIARDRRRVGRA